MLINEIPDDYLVAIFDYINNLEDLINCYKVCVKWSNLIAKRTEKVKYLIDQRGYSSDTVYYPSPCNFDATYLSKLFTNLTIADLASKLNSDLENAIQFVTKQKCLKGLISPLDEPIEKYCDNLEMLSVENFNANNLRNGFKLKQMEIFDYSLKQLKRDVHLFPNLERLKITIIGPDNPYDGPVLEKLKILELTFRRPCNDIFYGFQLMDSCPNLQSAHIFMRADTWVFDETMKHKSLQDLVIQYAGIDDENDAWNKLKRLLMKYPNLKHLSLRCRLVITDEHIEQVVDILPNLVLLDARECQEVTQEAADYVKDYCERNGRSVQFYFNGAEIPPYLPVSYIDRELIARGFDFMKNCFFRDHIHLSLFLIPNDY